MSSSLQTAPNRRRADVPGDPAVLTTLIDELILQQRTLQTPVAHFAEIHGRQPDLAGHYRKLIPLERPAPGEQYAFEVALDRCTGCKACVSACHNLNGLEPHESWRDTGLLLGGTEAPGWQQTITTACHHCEDPGCMNGCPVGAYQKDKDTGIVRHLDDQCIGCSYCILKCPFDVPKYSSRLGIVRKCDMCHQRLADGEAPACVQACPTEAIRITKVAVGRTSAPRGGWFQGEADDSCSGLPDFSITLPTTRYTGRPLTKTAFAADRDALVTQPSHWPLVLMLVLTQAGIGTLAAVSLRGMAHAAPLVVTGTALFILGMAAAVLHLGQPLKAWRFFLGLRTSWLSREILAFGLYGPIPLVLTLMALPGPGEMLIQRIPGLALCRWLALPLGVLAIFTSVMIYHDTRRSFWRLRRTASRFFGTATLFAVWALSFHEPRCAIGLVLLLGLKSLMEAAFLRHAGTADWSPDAHSARLLKGPLRSVSLTRHALAALSAGLVLIHPWLALPGLCIGEILERLLFFRAVQAPKMPGDVR